MPAGAPYGNKNAEKWDFKKSKKLFEDAIKLSEQTEEANITDKQGNITDVRTFYKYDFIGEIARELGTFHHNFRFLLDRFPELKPLKKQLDNNIESNCYFNTKKGGIREATGIVNLKSNWKWTDRVDNTTKGEPIKPQITAQSKEEADKINKLLSDFDSEE
jgi:hypothetical protein